MALEFLKDIVDLIRAGVGLVKGLQGRDVPAGTNELLAAAARSAKFADALNPNSQMFKDLADEEEAQIRRDTVEGLRFLTTEQNRATGRGMRGILNPERRDEAIAQVTTRNFQTAKEDARGRAREFLSRAAQANIGAAGAFQPALSTGLAVDSANRVDFLSAVAGTKDLANNAIDLFNFGPVTSTAQARSNATTGGNANRFIHANDPFTSF